MPTIRLKPNSADYADDYAENNAQPHGCEFDGCASDGIHKAPKHRGLNEFYHFCAEHITAYNKGWNFFDGMNAGEVQDHMERARYGDRPTWRYDADGKAEEHLRKKAWHYANFSNDSDSESQNKEKRGAIHGFDPASIEFEAMALFGLSPPTNLAEIKKRYKELAMKHHPDRNNGCLKSEELLKQINTAYTVLKTAYEKFDKLQDK